MMPPKTALTGVARKLRQNSTEVEKKLWHVLRNRQLEGWKFKRQYVLDSYVLDFVCLEAGIAIELDGGQHATQVEYDQCRTTAIEAKQLRMLRFWNNDVMENLEGVVSEILRCLPPYNSVQRHPPHPDPLPQGGEGKETA